MSVCLILIVCIVLLFVYMCVYYNITLYNLIIRKFKEFVTCVMCAYCYHFVITFCYKVSDKKIVKLVIFLVFDWLIRHVVYYLG